jgi:hypothetical protein
MLFSARPRKLALVPGLCAGLVGAAATAGVLAVLDDEPVASVSPTAIVQRYDAVVPARAASTD